MKVLVTGANGFLASHIVRNLLQNGYEVRAMLRVGASAPALHGLNIEFFRGNITDSNEVMNAVEGCDYVIHAAADTSQHYRHVSEYFPTNVLATGYIINAVQKHNCKRLVFVSTANTFGSGTHSAPGNENSPQSPLFSSSGYAVSKLMAQNLVVQNCWSELLDAVVVNPSFMLGSLDYKPSSGKIFQMILGKKIVFYPPGGKNFVSVLSVSKAIVNALTMGKSGQAFLLTGVDCSYREFFSKVIQKAKQKSLLVPIPGFLLRLLGFLGSIIQKIGVNTSLTTVNTAILCEKFSYSNKRAIEALNLENTSIDSLVDECLDWFKDRKSF
ncbi:MAG: NAD-dependent dehydratase [Bacteroidetes bacterium HGW-Bacteroidetes-6]|jgi:dihydroflavonol-4-reductase|nr:MAG: NAD-dependent dehydratase [Bacteroidetes bacterium HGW-Bacteroidetes-6]